MLIFINFLALRQAVTPAPLLGRMTSTMRWLILLPAGPGALLGGWLGEHVGLRAVAGLRRRRALLLALAAWRLPTHPRRARCCREPDAAMRDSASGPKRRPLPAERSSRAGRRATALGAARSGRPRR